MPINVGKKGPNKLEQKINPLGYVLIKTLSISNNNSSNNNRIFHTAREKDQVLCKGRSFRIIHKFSLVTQKAGKA